MVQCLPAWLALLPRHLSPHAQDRASMLRVLVGYSAPPQPRRHRDLLMHVPVMPARLTKQQSQKTALPPPRCEGERSRITQQMHRHTSSVIIVLSHEILRWFVIVVGNCHPQLQQRHGYL